MNLMKALVPSAILTLILSAVIGAFGVPQPYLNMQQWALGDVGIYWSWSLFFVAMALNGALVLVLARRAQQGDPDALA